MVKIERRIKRSFRTFQTKLSIFISSNLYIFNLTSTAKGDENVKKVKAALLKDKVVEVWEINTAIEGTGENAGKYESCYYNGYITEFELTANAEDFTEYSLTVGVFGEPKDGYATLTQEQQEAAQYVFKDTVVQTSAEGNS